jgi:two-component system phosphate regulon response regulator PhoB
VLLDVNLPGIDGFETARRLRCDPSTRRTLIVMLTARAHPDDIVAGLSEVADDYVTKPFLPRVLVARIQALLRRGRVVQPGPEDAHEIVRCGDLAVDLTAHSVTLAGKDVHTTRTEFEILTLFASHPDRVFTRQQIIDRVRGDDYAITERVVDYQVSGLRRKLGPAGALIHTVHGVGYKFTRPNGGAVEPVSG